MSLEGALAFMAHVRSVDDICDVDPKTLGSIVTACETLKEPFSVLGDAALSEAQRWSEKYF